jgi:hypothetical protein
LPLGRAQGVGELLAVQQGADLQIVAPRDLDLFLFELVAGHGVLG